MYSQIQSLFRTWSKVLSLVLMMALGLSFPQVHALAFLIQYLLMTMLFFAFLDIDISRGALRLATLWILLANLAIAFIAHRLLAPVDPDLALAAFITAIAPTAISSSVIISFIEGRVDYVAAAVLVTNVAMALVVPFALPLVAGVNADIDVWGVLQPVLVVMFVPLLLSRLVRRLPQAAQAVVARGKPYSYLVWLLTLLIISAEGSDFVRNNPASPAVLLHIALASLAICILNFGIGALIGGRRYWQEASQALGQKNNSFVIWIALTFLNPLVAMGPTFYILYHNLYNSFQIYLFERRRNRPAPAETAEV